MSGIIFYHIFFILSAILFDYSKRSEFSLGANYDALLSDKLRGIRQCFVLSSDDDNNGQVNFSVYTWRKLHLYLPCIQQAIFTCESSRKYAEKCLKRKR